MEIDLLLNTILDAESGGSQANALLLEDGTPLLLEDGTPLILE